ncbi:thiamine pyrophosphate-dependent dehydrogenase E1 component subunit alpha [Streptococcaceae bacterium ESL0729]|nr:thiamine pyrophosphate-dependent dehydrogenase E1 component subunit alpha [Streptococcaceae bacterium ESL0729]
MNNKYEVNQLLAWYSTMLEIRHFENILDDYNRDGKLYGTTHLYNGQEAVATGICQQLDNNDLILSTHRNHGHALAKGTDGYQMYAEIFGKKTGTNGGKVGSMHISDPKVGNMGGNGIVGGNFPVALGLATALKMDKKDEIVVCFSGDGATNEGTFHESLNLASIWKLPIIFVIENNQYAMSSDASKMIAGSIAERAHAYKMKSFKVDGQDIFEVATTFEEARRELKNGPVLLEAMTYRFRGHSRSDAEKYRSKDEFLKYEDPILKLRNTLMNDYHLSADQLALLDEKAYKKMEAAADKAWTDEDVEFDFNKLEGEVYAD